MLHTALLFSSIILFVDHVNSFGTGVPSSACKDMAPGPPHHPNQVTDDEAENPPFTLKAANKNGGVTGLVINKIRPENLICLNNLSDFETK